MGDKFDGAIASAADAGNIGVPLTDAMASLLLHETLIAQDENGEAVHLHAVQNPQAGGIMLATQPKETSPSRMQQVLAQTQMTSMLSDHGRISKYATAISMFMKKHRGCHVLDIGAGTGLLAALAAKGGASRVDAIEMYGPMARMAKKIIRKNKLDHIVNVINAMSTDVDVSYPGHNSPPDTSIPARADMLVTEIFDSALLGENCLRVIKHAKEHLLRPNATVIPAKATVYGVVVSSEFLARFQSLGKDFPLHRDSNGWKCQGGAVGIPIHFDTLNEGDDYSFLTEEFKIFQFDFSEPLLHESDLQRQRTVNLERTRSGKADAVLTWWDLDLNDDDVTHSTRMGVEIWQDHWLQVVYPIIGDQEQSSHSSNITLTLQHNELSFRFYDGKHAPDDMINDCRCGLHNIMTPSRIHDVGDPDRLEWLCSRIRAAIEDVSLSPNRDASVPLRCLDVSDGAICSALAVREDAPGGLEIISVEEEDEVSSFVFSQICRRIKKDKNDVISEFDALSELVKRDTRQQQDGDGWRPYDIILAEPYTKAMHPYPVYTLGNLVVQRKALCGLLSDDYKMVPGHARIYAQLVHFPKNTLQRSFGSISNVQGIDHTPYKEIVHRRKWENMPTRFSLPLYQYRAMESSVRTCIQSVRLDTSDESFLRQLKADATETTLKLHNGNNRVEAVRFWVEYDGRHASRTERYELLWLIEGEESDIQKCGGLNVNCEFSEESGTWDIQVSPAKVNTKPGRTHGDA